MNPFEIDDLKGHIFSFLRKKPHKQCPDCLDVLEWDPGKKFKKFVEWGGFNHKFIMCNDCYRDNFLRNYQHLHICEMC